jgi:NodT family efflux transporter outer membrane factor (OMF) lipoprotein
MNIKRLFLFLFLSGCTVGPNYKPPENTVSQEWKGPPPSSEISYSREKPVTDWWKVFQDSLLDKYIEMAATHNYDILAAEANILQARALKQVAASSLFPQVSADLNATKTFFSKNGPIFTIGTAAGDPIDETSTTTGLPFNVQIPQIQSLYNALFDASWEIDLFGKTRRSVEAAQATMESAIEQRNDILISVLAEVARNYIEIRSDQKRRLLIEENIQLLEQNAEIIKVNMEKGFASGLDLENIKAELASARAELPDIDAQIYRGIYTLSILTGNFPEALVDELFPYQELPALPHSIAVGLRSDLLRRRPDVRQAERQLAAATANVGVAVASFYPTITLLADAGFQSLKIKNLFNSRSKTWAMGGDFNIPIFQGGRLVGNLRANRAAASAAAYSYQQTVLVALQDAESALISYSQDLVKSKELNKNMQNNQMLVYLTHERYDKGLVSLLDFLSSKRQLITSQITLLTSDTIALLDLISLYKSLGGGWEPQQNE